MKKTLFVLGNGPSLKDVDITQFQSGVHDTIGMNVAYRYWKEIGWYPTYFVCFDFAITEFHKKEFINLVENKDNNKIKKFFFRTQIVSDDKVKAVPNPERGCITTGTGACRMGIEMGYERLVLLGIDCNYIEHIKESKAIGGGKLEIESTPESNPNYFFDSYQQAGDIYYVPNCKSIHVGAWNQLLSDMNSTKKFEVIQCSKNSKADMFKYVPLKEILKEFENDLHNSY